MEILRKEAEMLVEAGDENPADSDKTPDPKSNAKTNAEQEPKPG